MIELAGSFITGMMVGIEFPTPSDFSEDLVFIMVVDLVIFRLTLLKWNKED